jgi:5-methylcytosine-specific restriction endonuclease McrBC regulatory subunit McrC
MIPLLSKEHSVIENQENINELFFEIGWDANPETYLGLHYEWNEDKKKQVIKTHYFVGVSWLHESKSFMQISPKIENLDYLHLFLQCLSNPIVAKHFSKTYKIFFNEPLIKIDCNNFAITPLLIAHFLSIVKIISKKGLKKGYITVTQNLTGKIKGKIKVQQNITKNLNSNRLDRNICQYQIHTQDCLENRIIKTALEQVRRYINNCFIEKTFSAELLTLLKYNRVSFESVSEINVSQSDFKLIKHSPFYAEYKDALKLAEMIFKRLGFNPQRSNGEIMSKTPPFYIDMPELFERYIEVQLRKHHEDILVGYGNEEYSETKSTWSLRPDFLIPSLSMIIDAKYKVWYHKESHVDFKSDFQQLSLYARTKDVLKKLNSENQLPKLVFIYPFENDDKKAIDLNNLGNPQNEFEEIYKIGVNLPTL